MKPLARFSHFAADVDPYALGRLFGTTQRRRNEKHRSAFGEES